MKEFVLNYYPQFKCVAGECKNTCCEGWEMCIDPQTLKEYKNEKGEFKEKLNNGINFRKSKFKTDKNGRCAFLNKCGLCDIIINLGEEKLCQVCRDHPRFRSFFSDRVEMGLGFCCEQATRIILAFEDKITTVLTFDDKKENELDFVEIGVSNFREQVLNIVQDRSFNINDRIEEVLKQCNFSFEKLDFKRVVKTFLSFEKLDDRWAKRLKNISKKHFDKRTKENLSLYAEQFLANSFYRHLLGAEDILYARAIAIACVLSWWLIKSIFEEENVSMQNNFELIVDLVRAYSAEVEYSEININKLFVFCSKLIKI